MSGQALIQVIPASLQIAVDFVFVYASRYCKRFAIVRSRKSFCRLVQVCSHKVHTEDKQRKPRQR